MKIYLIGFMGSGKTHWGKQLSQKLKLPFFDLDDEIVAEEGKSITEIFATHGEEYFRQKEKRCALHTERKAPIICYGLRRWHSLFL